jgi:hypothetical protein
MDYYVNVKTQEEYDELMEILKAQGYKWNSGVNPAVKKYWLKYYWLEYKDETTIKISKHNRLSFSNKLCYKGKPIITLEEYKKEINNMKKSDLKVGMLVEYRDGQRRMIMPYGLVDQTGIKCHTLESYYEDLKHAFDDKVLDIVKVYDVLLEGFDFECRHRKLLWERKETVELTLEEIADKFGVDVDKLKIKK